MKRNIAMAQNGCSFVDIVIYLFDDFDILNKITFACVPIGQVNK